jgi:hypothetical protein
MSGSQDPKRELAMQVVVAVAAGTASLQNPVAGAVATGLSPLALAGLGRISAAIRGRRLEHSAETLTVAADASGAETVEEFAAFVEAAVSDDEHQELLARALIIAQDTAMRAKRHAIGRALAAAASDTGTKVDEELLFIRAVADLDAPHIRLLALMASEDPSEGRLSASVFPGSWSLQAILLRDRGLEGALPALIRTLEAHGLIETVSSAATPLQSSRQAYRLTSAGGQLLERLAEGE